MDLYSFIDNLLLRHEKVMENKESIQQGEFIQLAIIYNTLEQLIELEGRNNNEIQAYLNSQTRLIAHAVHMTPEDILNLDRDMPGIINSWNQYQSDAEYIFKLILNIRGILKMKKNIDPFQP